MKKYYEVAVFQVGGIKCDTNGCGWYDDDVSVIDYKSWLNKPCPKCGGNLLTQKDFNAVLTTMLITEKLDRWCNKWLPAFLLEILSSKAKYHEFDMDGTGRIRVKK